MSCLVLFFSYYLTHPDLHSFPTRRSSDLFVLLQPDHQSPGGTPQVPYERAPPSERRRDRFLPFPRLTNPTPDRNSFLPSANRSARGRSNPSTRGGGAEESSDPARARERWCARPSQSPRPSPRPQRRTGAKAPPSTAATMET